MPTPTLTFNPATSIPSGVNFTILDSAATVTDGGNTLGAVRITLGPGLGSLGVVSGGVLTTTGTIGTISYLYESAKRLLSLTGATATGADFTQVLRLVGYSKGLAEPGITQSVCVNLGLPIYSTDTGHYYEVASGNALYASAKTAAAAKTFLGLTGYLASVTSAAEGVFLFERFRTEGWVSAFFANGSWSWTAGPESGSVFWNGSETGSAVAGKYSNWASGEPANPTGKPYLYFGYQTNALWFGSADIEAPYYIEYSTVSGTGDDGLSGTRSVFVVTVAYSAEIAALMQSTTPVQVSLVNGVVTSAIGVALAGITIGASNATHIQVSIDLGTNNAGKRRQARGFRVIGGSERELAATRTQVGEVYNFVFLKTVDGSSSVNLLLN